MTIDWLSFLSVVLVSLISATGLIVLFSLGLRFGDRERDGGRRIPLAVVMFVLCGLLVALGIIAIVPAFHSFLGW